MQRKYIVAEKKKMSLELILRMKTNTITFITS